MLTQALLLSLFLVFASRHNHIHNDIHMLNCPIYDSIAVAASSHILLLLMNFLPFSVRMTKKKTNCSKWTGAQAMLQFKASFFSFSDVHIYAPLHLSEGTSFFASLVIVLYAIELFFFLRLFCIWFSGCLKERVACVIQIIYS